jgi:hypothetical protein
LEFLMVQHSAVAHTGLAVIATDTIWDAAGDVVVGSGSNTAARLAIGAAGGALSRINGAVAWNSGTSFPGAAATGDRYWRTDLGSEFYYDGTRWLSTQLLNLPIWSRYSSATAIDATTTYGNATSLGTGLDMYLVEWRLALFVNTGNGLTGTHFYTITLDKLDSANAATNLSSITANSATASTWINLTDALGDVIDSSAFPAFRIIFTKSNTPSSLFPAVTITYRLIAT